MKQNRQLPNFLRAFDEKDWFVYADHAIKGPFFAKDLYKMSSYDTKGEKVLIAQKKHSKWYELIEARRKAHAAPHVSRRESRQLNHEVSRKLKNNNRSPDQQRRQALQGAEALFAESSPTTDAPAALASRPSPIPANKIKAQKSVSKQSKLKGRKLGEDFRRLKESVPHPSISERALPPVLWQQLANDSSQSPDQTPTANEFSLDEKTAELSLRLGKCRGPGVFVSSLISLGLTNVFWYQALCREAFYHASGQKLQGWRPYLHGICAVMPLVSIYSFGKLLGVIQELERQNNYSFSKVSTLWLSLFPSLLLLRFQKALNIHWALHKNNLCSGR